MSNKQNKEKQNGQKFRSSRNNKGILAFISRNPFLFSQGKNFNFLKANFSHLSSSSSPYSSSSSSLLSLSSFNSCLSRSSLVHFRQFSQQPGASSFNRIGVSANRGVFVSKEMKVIPVPVLSDNYAYLVIDEKEKIAIAIDPAEPEKVLEAAKKEGVKVTLVATTHHHWDHAGGNKKFLELNPGIEVLGGDERIEAVTRLVKDEETFKVGSLEARVLSTPCHTSGHVLYFFSNPSSSQPLLFTGDTLFIGGCGRFFEGNAEQMQRALGEVIPSLPDSTLVYCGHEYTVANLRFAITIEPNNQELKKKLEWAIEQTEKKKGFTIPSTIQEELSYNPFMRTNQLEVQKAVGKTDAIQTMDELRTRKNNFK
jgi:hydroxyacylglutathione hydrolase